MDFSDMSYININLKFSTNGTITMLNPLCRRGIYAMVILVMLVTNSEQLRPDNHPDCVLHHKHETSTDRPADELRKAGSAIFGTLRHSDATPDTTALLASDSSVLAVSGLLSSGQATALHRTYDSRMLSVLAARAQNKENVKSHRKGRCGTSQVCKRIRRMRKHRKRLERIERRRAFELYRDPTWRRINRGKGSRKKTQQEKNRPTISPSATVLRSNRPPVVITKASDLRRDWCRTDPLKQRITEPGCRPKVIMNNFCYGQCNSFYIPNTSQDINNGNGTTASAFQSCAFCKPIKTGWTTVKLQCPGLTPPYRNKPVMKIQKCRCQLEILKR